MNTLKELVLQEADTQKILLKIQTVMKCALEVRAGPWQSREMPYFPALLHHVHGCTCTVERMVLHWWSFESELC